MTQLINPKLIYKDGRLFLIDAPDVNKYLSEDGEFIYDIEYNQALSKAPTWEIKNKEEVLKLIWQQYDESIIKDANRFWQPEQGKLYDIPAGYTYVFEETQKGKDKFDVVAILMPQEEVMSESQEDLWNTWLEVISIIDKHDTAFDIINDLKSKFILTRR